jgi:hypothetical protein
MLSSSASSILKTNGSTSSTVSKKRKVSWLDEEEDDYDDNNSKGDDFMITRTSQGSFHEYNKDHKDAEDFDTDKKSHIKQKKNKQNKEESQPRVSRNENNEFYTCTSISDLRKAHEDFVPSPHPDDDPKEHSDMNETNLLLVEIKDDDDLEETHNLKTGTINKTKIPISRTTTGEPVLDLQREESVLNKQRKEKTKWFSLPLYIHSTSSTQGKIPRAKNATTLRNSWKQNRKPVVVSEKKRETKSKLLTFVNSILYSLHEKAVQQTHPFYSLAIFVCIGKQIQSSVRIEMYIKGAIIFIKLYSATKARKDKTTKKKKKPFSFSDNDTTSEHSSSEFHLTHTFILSPVPKSR